MDPAQHSAPPQMLYARVRRAIEATPASTTRTHVKLAAALAAAAMVTMLLVALASQLVYGQQAVGLRTGLQSASWHAAAALGVVALVVGSTFVAVWRGRDGLGFGVTSLALTAAFVPLLYAAVVLMDPARSFMTTVAISPWGARCMMIAALVGSAALVAFVTALRWAAPAATRARGAALGAAAGAWAGLAVFAFCPSSDPQHLIFGHVLPVLAFTLLGALAIARALRP